MLKLLFLFLFIPAGIGYVAIARWCWRHRNDGAGLPGVLRPWLGTFNS